MESDDFIIVCYGYEHVQGLKSIFIFVSVVLFDVFHPRLFCFDYLIIVRVLLFIVILVYSVSFEI